MQDFVCNIEALIKQYKVGTLKDKICLSLLRNIGDYLEHLFLNFRERIAVRLFKRLSFSLNTAFEIIYFLLKLASLLI